LSLWWARYALCAALSTLDCFDLTDGWGQRVANENREISLAVFGTTLGEGGRVSILPDLIVDLCLCQSQIQT
jgi:hypothetical protein